MKPFSSQGTYLLDHPKYRTRKKHLNAKLKEQFKKCRKGAFVYIYETEKDYGCNVYTAKPKQKVAMPESMSDAIELRKILLASSAV